jgi:hypothetical protein
MTAEASTSEAASTQGASFAGEHLTVPLNTLVFSIDDMGDERMNHPVHPVFVFGGVVCVAEHRPAISEAWRAMKSRTFPQVRGPLHAKRHLRDRLPEPKRRAVLAAMDHRQLGRFGAVLTSRTVVPMDAVVRVACGMLANRLGHIAAGLVSLGLWGRAPARVLVVFERSPRLERYLPEQFPEHITVDGPVVPGDRCFMDKSVADPFLEMADFVANTVGKNIKHQIANGRAGCTKNFQALFRDVGPPLADYMEASEVIFPSQDAA